MSDTPSPIPSSDAPKPRLSLAPKVSAPAEASAAAPAPEPAPTSTVPTAHVTPPIMQSASNVTPPGLVPSGAPRQNLKLQGAANVHPANPEKFATAKFASPMPAASDDAPSGVIVALSGIAAAAAIAFAALLYLKTQ